MKDLRQFGIVLGVILGALGSVHFFKGRAGVYPWFFGTASTALFLGIFMPWALRPVFFVFTKVTLGIGWFVTKLILVLVYYMALVPMGVLIKIFRKDPLDRKINKDAKSYWIERESMVPAKAGLEKQF